MHTTELHGCIGKGRRHHMSKLHDNADAMQGACRVCALRALVNLKSCQVKSVVLLLLINAMKTIIIA